MSTLQSSVSDMLVTVTSREIQRGVLAKMRGDRAQTERHLLAAAHLELVLADDYTRACNDDLAFRSRLSAASCFWRAGYPDRARPLFAGLAQDFPAQAAEVQEAVDELEQMGKKGSP
jgi:hypothetical protein